MFRPHAVFKMCLVGFPHLAFVTLDVHSFERQAIEETNTAVQMTGM